MRLIDADALEKEIKRVYCTGCNDYHGIRCRACNTDDALDMIDDASTIDAEPVTRCNMCKYYEAEVGFCHYHDHGMHWDDFCSRCAKMDLEAR